MKPPEEAVQRRFEDLSDRVRGRRHELEFHALYLRIQETRALRIFMRTHVFAVWDFMSLAKSLQRHLTCMQLPWLPPADRESARFINEIVLDEESDEVRPGYPISHFELYLKAMDEEGADRGPIDAFIAALRGGHALQEALAEADVDETVRAFVRNTMDVAAAGPHEVASAFLFGREQVIPGMFSRLYDVGAGHAVPDGRLGRRVLSARRKLSRALNKSRVATELERRSERSSSPHAAFELYLKRHIELDGEEHGPMGARMLMRLCGDDAVRWDEAERAAVRAMSVRQALWDGVLAEIG